MPLIIDPVGSAKLKYQEKLRKERDKAKRIYIPYYDRDEKKWKIFELPYFEIEVLEYGPWQDHPVFTDSGYPAPGMGAPSIGAGGQEPQKPGESEGQPGAGQPGAGQQQPGPGSGQPGTPLYPPPGEGEGPFAGVIPMDPIYGEVGIGEVNIEDIAKELELEILKPAKKTKLTHIKFSSVSYSGPKSLLDWDLTFHAALERQEAWKKIIEERIKKLEEEKKELGSLKELGKISKSLYEVEVERIDFQIGNLNKIKEKLPVEGEFKISIEREDERYRLPQVILEEEKNALVIYIRDVSGSITDAHLKASQRLTKYIDAWIAKCYPKVVRVYVAHNYDAWEETEEGYYGLKSGGGTRFASAYELVLAIFEGKEYKTKLSQRRKINPNDYDIYIVQMTDGFGQSPQEEVKPLEQLMPNLTRFCYMEERIDYSTYETEYKKFLENHFKNEYESGKLRTAVLQHPEDEEIKKVMKVFFGKKK